MDVTPYLSALSRYYHLKKVQERDGMRVWQMQKKGRLFQSSLFLACTDLFYLPENEYRMREALSHMALPVRFRWQTPCIIVLCSYNGMIDLSRDDLRSFTDRALINYLLLERESGIWIGEDTFYRGGAPIPREVRRILQTASAPEGHAHMTPV